MGSATLKLKIVQSYRNNLLGVHSLGIHHKWNSGFLGKLMSWSGRLLSIDLQHPNLMAHGVVLPSSNCPFCDSDSEDFDHVLVTCDRVSGVWRKVWSWWNLPRPFSFPPLSIVEIMGYLELEKPSIHATGDDTETIKNDDYFRVSNVWLSFALFCILVCGSLALLVPFYRFSLARTSNLNDEFRAVSEIGHNEIYGADLDLAVPSTKLYWIPSLGMLFRKLRKKLIAFADITVSDGLSAVFKIGMNSGEVSYIDFRNLYKEGELELWSEALMSSSITTSKNGKEEQSRIDASMGQNPTDSHLEGKPPRRDGNNLPKDTLGGQQKNKYLRRMFWVGQRILEELGSQI
ncbi:hypothetical protein Tco_0882296 [Tanacetum coccineum]